MQLYAMVNGITNRGLWPIDQPTNLVSEFAVSYDAHICILQRVVKRFLTSSLILAGTGANSGDSA